MGNDVDIQRQIVAWAWELGLGLFKVIENGARVYFCDIGCFCSRDSGYNLQEFG